MKQVLSNPKDLDRLLLGLGIMGTGGGGDPKGWGRSVFEADRAAGRTYELLDPSDLSDEAFIVSGGYLGSVAEDTTLRRVVSQWETEFELERAIHIVEAEHGRRADALVPFELGGGNTPVILSCASRMGIPVIDGDGVGRAAPETHMCSFLGHGISLTPMPIVGAGGTEVLVRRGDLFLADDSGRCLASRKGGLLANAHYGMSGRDLKRAVVPNSITAALKLGEFVSCLTEAGECGLDAVCSFLGGFPLFHGEVEALVKKDSPGFYAGEVHLRGIGRDSGRQLTLVVKNEVMCAKDGEEPLVIFPDLVLVLEPGTLEGLMTPVLIPGKEVLVAAVPCHQRLREALFTSVGAEAFAASRYGEEFAYVPVEELLQGRC